MGARNSSQGPVADDPTIRNMPGLLRSTFQRKGHGKRRREDRDRDRDGKKREILLWFGTQVLYDQ